ncbi:MAG: DUF1592 domain-containing protein [Myxococcales bacterium]|nr:DUF1592 domain-containing protein [Myxococcales bacterium]
MDKKRRWTAGQRQSLVGVLGLCLAVGCSGKIGGKDDGEATGTPGVTPATFECDASAEPTELPLRRLSRVQYVNSVGEVVRRTVPAQATTILAGLDPLFARFPEDRRVAKDDDKRGGFRRLDQVVQQGHADVQYDVAVALGKALTADAKTLGAAVGACATDADTGNDAACLDEFIRRFGLVVQRRPLADDDVKFYRDIAGTTPVQPAALADVIATLLASPRFVYHVEHGVGTTTTAPLSGHELASRLAYHFWQSMPDAELLAAAASGKLDTEAGYAEQVARLFADPKTDAALDVFALEWLWLDDLPAMDGRVGDPIYDAFAAGFTPTPALRDALVADTLAAFRHVVRSGGGFADFFLESRSFARDADVAKIYGVAPMTADPLKVDPARVGLLTRPALLATGSANTRPIMKGVFIRKALLCDEIPPPPAEAAKVKPELSDHQTTREVVEALTQQKGTACNGCHSTLINPLGFSTENFDALGRPRATQRLFDATGKLVADKPVLTTSIPQVTADDQRPSSGAADVTRYLLESGRVQACFARQYFRFTFGRLEDDKKDGCALQAAAEATKGGKSVAEVLRQMALAPAFRRRTFR